MSQLASTDNMPLMLIYSPLSNPKGQTTRWTYVCVECAVENVWNALTEWSKVFFHSIFLIDKSVEDLSSREIFFQICIFVDSEHFKLRCISLDIDMQGLSSSDTDVWVQGERESSRSAKKAFSQDR